jgi:hypothetical protein
VIEKKVGSDMAMLKDKLQEINSVHGKAISI